MKTKNKRLGLSILAGGLSFVGAANAMDLIVNGSFESANAGEWKFFSTYNYSAQYFTGAAIPGTETPGSKYSWKHGSASGSWNNFVTPTNEVDHLQYNLQFADFQRVNLTNALTGAAIDGGLGRYSFSSWLASYGQPHQNPEQPYVVLRFFSDSAGTVQVGGNVIFDRTSNVNAVMYADGTTTIPADLSADHNMIKYAALGTVPTGARTATVYITRSPNAGVSGNPDTYVDLVKLDVININDTTALDSASPANGQTGVPPDAVVTVNLRDIGTQVNPSSIQVSFDNVLVSPTVQKAGTLTTIQYDPPGLLAPLSTHTAKVVWSDNGTPVTTKTNNSSFTVGPYADLVLGPPIYLETFDSVPEGGLPAGWSVANATDLDSIPGNDLNNFHSDAFLDWTVVNHDTITNWFSVTPGGADFVNIFNVAPNQVINHAVVSSLISSNCIIAVSDRSANQKQIDYLFTGDYNLSGKANVYLSFHNIYIQNQNNIAAVEYSINGGATWLPALYMLEPQDIALDAQGNIDASNTFARIQADVPNVDAGTLVNGYYGQYIGVNSNQWAGLAPFLGARGDDDQAGSKRVEVLRLAQADNQPAVRFRMVMAGKYAWYFGIDDFGLYSIASSSPPLVSGGPTPAAQTVAIGNPASITIPNVYGLGPLTYQWRRNGANLPGKTAQTLVFPAIHQTDAGTYDVVVSNPGGSVTSSPPASVLTVINPAVFVTGQWDFNGNLAATLGRDLSYFDSGVSNDTSFATTTSLGIPDINGQPTTVMHFIPAGTPWGGYVMFHGAAPNGGGAYVNQYTLIYDIFIPFGTWRSLLQTALGNGNDGDLFFNPSGGIGISSVYDGIVTAGDWHRVAVAFDLSGPGQAPVLTKFIDGVKVGNQTGGLSGPDGRFALDPSALLFADNDGDDADTYVSSVQFSNGRRPDAFLAALGGPSAAKIPGAITARLESGHPVIRWTGGVPLQSANALTGPWSVVSGATSPYSPPAGSPKFYRPQIP
jgi:hypothetical protein